MYCQQLQNHTDTFLPTISIDMKDVFADFEPYTTNNNSAPVNCDSATADIANLDALPPQETMFEAYDETPALANGDSAAGGIANLDALPQQKAIVEFNNENELESLWSFLNTCTHSFSILPSKKERGKPYYINDKKRILTTKRNEPIHIQLDNCKPGQKILLTLRYSDQDYYDRPMVCNGCSHAYKGCSSVEDHSEANFCVRSRDGRVEYIKRLEDTVLHPTAVITVAEKCELVDLLAAFKCRNSCSEHKKYGGDRTLRLMLLDEQEQVLCCNDWSLRVCESAKRDHNLFLSKGELSRSDSDAGLCVPCQPIGVPPPTLDKQNSSALVKTADADVKPPSMKRAKLEETFIHLIEEAPTSTQPTVGGPPVFRCVPSPFTSYSSNRSRSNSVVSVPGCFEAKPLLPIAPPASAVGVVPVVVYSNNEADKMLLVAFAERLGMKIYNLQS